jgi:hypothetical protein
LLSEESPIYAFADDQRDTGGPVIGTSWTVFLCSSTKLWIDKHGRIRTDVWGHSCQQQLKPWIKLCKEFSVPPIGMLCATGVTHCLLAVCVEATMNCVDDSGADSSIQQAGANDHLSMKRAGVVRNSGEGRADNGTCGNRICALFTQPICKWPKPCSGWKILNGLDEQLIPSIGTGRSSEVRSPRSKA